MTASPLNGSPAKTTWELALEMFRCGTEYRAPETPVISHDELQRERVTAPLTSWVEPREELLRPKGARVFIFQREDAKDMPDAGTDTQIRNMQVIFTVTRFLIHWRERNHV